MDMNDQESDIENIIFRLTIIVINIVIPYSQF